LKYTVLVKKLPFYVEEYLEGDINVKNGLCIFLVCLLLFSYPNGFVHAASIEKRVVLIIDDFGNRIEGTKEMLNLPIPITVAVMPFSQRPMKMQNLLIKKGMMSLFIYLWNLNKKPED
jgi:hypothetical protein